MNWKTLAICGALSTTAALAGCGGDGGGEPEAVTRRYILSEGDIPMPTPEGEAVGFNLDGMVSDGTGEDCVSGATDFTSSISGEVGVDNQLAGVISILGSELGPDGVRGALLEQIASGNFLLVMDVTANSLTNDSSVEVHLFLANRPGPACDNAAMTCPSGSICPEDATAEEPSNCGPVTGSDGLVTADQEFTQATNIATVTGSITAGVLSVEVDELPLNLVISGENISLTLESARIRGSISDDSIDNGEIGAQVSVAAIVELAATLGLAVDEGTIRTVANPDLEPGSDPEICAAISAGLSFSAADAADPE